MFNVERYAYFEFIKLKSYLKTLVKVMFIRMFYTVTDFIFIGKFYL